jgi:signal transduction histidine kinase/CheY-like chemotaxis protein
MQILERFAAARAADAVELEQAQLRLALNALVDGYMLVAFLWDRVLDDRELFLLAFLAGAYLLCIAQFGWTVLRPGVNHGRRSVGVALDIASLALLLFLGGETAVPIAGFLLWVVIGNGFRFGRRYLHYAQVFALATVALLLAFSDYWRGHPMFGAALILMLLAIPMYVAVLVSRLQAAGQRLDEARGEAEAANTAKTKFLAAASHDLRQPMQALSMYASVLEDRVTDANALRVVHGIQLSVKTLEQLFDSLLDISKIESGVIKPHVVAFPLMPLIENVVASESAIAAQKNLDLRVVRTSASVRSDPALLERMLKNLVTNAIRYTEHGRIVIGCRRAGRGGLRLEIVDSGIGISTEDQERIFEEYYQLAGNSTQGLGLGLPIVKSLGGLLGHAVGVKSALGRGSVFSIDLPRAPDVPLPCAASPSPRSDLSGIQVVLVDDDVEIRDSMRLLLESWACRVVSGGTLGEVQEKLRRQRLAPDALIVDYRLAAMTGLQVIDQLRAAHGKELPALIITGTANLTLLQQRAPGTPVALKPVPAGKLRAFLAQALVRQSAVAAPLRDRA